MSKLSLPLDISRESGGAAVEYIIVSIFGLVLAIGSISLVGRAAQEKIKTLEEKLGIDLDSEILTPFGT